MSTEQIQRLLDDAQAELTKGLDSMSAAQELVLKAQNGLIGVEPPPTVEIIDRGGAGLRKWAASPRTMKTSRGFFVHWSAGHNAHTIADGVKYWKRIQSIHMNKEKPFDDIGYSFGLDSIGTAYEGRGWGVQGAHTRHYNNEWHGLCWMGGLEGHTHVPPVVFEKLDALRHLHIEQYGACEFRGHRDVDATACPGDQLMAWVEAQRAVA